MLPPEMLLLVAKAGSQTTYLPPTHCQGRSLVCVVIFPSPKGRSHFGIVLLLSGLLPPCHVWVPLWVVSCQGCVGEGRGGWLACSRPVFYRIGPAASPGKPPAQAMMERDNPQKSAGAECVVTKLDGEYLPCAGSCSCLCI